MESSGEIPPPHESVGKQQYEPIWGIKKETGKELADLRRRMSEARDAGVILYESEYTAETQEKFYRREPRIACPVELPPTADALDAVYSIPIDPYLLTDSEHKGAIIAGGFPTYSIVFEDDPSRIEDDVLRLRVLAASPHDIYDPEGVHRKQLFNGYFAQRHERTVAQLTNVLTILDRVTHLPFLGPAQIPLFAFRLGVNARNLAYDEIHHISHLLPGMNNPEVYADLVRSLKPYFEKTDDHEIQDAIVALKIPEAVSWLETQGIDGNVVPFSPHEHSAGEYQWNSEATQIRTVQDEVTAIVDIRRRLGEEMNQPVTPIDWERLERELIKHFAGVKLFGVTNTPGANTIAALPHRIPEIRQYTSPKIAALIHTTMEELTIP